MKAKLIKEDIVLEDILSFRTDNSTEIQSNLKVVLLNNKNELVSLPISTLLSSDDGEDNSDLVSDYFTLEGRNLLYTKVFEEGSSIGGSLVSRGGNRNTLSNTAFGYDSLRDMLTGENNTAVGTYSLYVNVAGSNNTAVGYAALTVAGGSSQTAVGSYALTKITMGERNTAIGNAALFEAVVGVDNVAIGCDSLRNLIGANYNTAVGTDAGKNISTGNNNTGLGYRALGGLSYPNLTGTNNICIGSGAGIALTEGNNNILIENITHSGVTTGNNNIILNPIGRSGISTGNNNIILGGFPEMFNPNLSDTMVFGTGNGIERFRVDNYGNFGIGTSSPNSSSILDLSSTAKTLTIPRMNTTQQNAINSPIIGSMVYNNQILNGQGGYQFRDTLGWFGVKRTDFSFIWIINNPSLNSGSNYIVGTTGSQRLGADTIQVVENTSNSYNSNTGAYTNNTNQTIVVHISGVITFNSGSWTAGQIVEIAGVGGLLTRGYAPTTGTYSFSVSFSADLPITAGGIENLTILQNSGTAKTINSTYSRLCFCVR